MNLLDARSILLALLACDALALGCTGADGEAADATAEDVRHHRDADAGSSADAGPGDAAVSLVDAGSSGDAALADATSSADAGAAVGTTVTCGYGTFAVDRWPTACWRPYADTSPFNRRIGPTPTLAASSAQIISTMRSWNGGGFSDLVAGVADTGSDWSKPLYWSQATDPLFTIHSSEYSTDLEGLQIRLPDAARPAGGGDGHLAVVDQASGTEYDFWQVVSKPAGGGVLEVHGAGKTSILGDSLDVGSGDANAARWGIAAGLIRAQEMAAGEIDHALFLVAKCDSGGVVWPATGHGASCGDGSGPPEGAHIQLAMSDTEIDALSVPPWKKVILRALAHYGAFVGDTGGSPWDLQFESGSTSTSFGRPDPIVTFAQGAVSQGQISVSSGRYYFDLNTGVDWSRLRVLDPCVAKGTCP